MKSRNKLVSDKKALLDYQLAKGVSQELDIVSSKKDVKPVKFSQFGFNKCSIKATSLVIYSDMASNRYSENYDRNNRTTKTGQYLTKSARNKVRNLLHNLHYAENNSGRDLTFFTYTIPKVKVGADYIMDRVITNLENKVYPAGHYFEGKRMYSDKDIAKYIQSVNWGFYAQDENTIKKCDEIILYQDDVKKAMIRLTDRLRKGRYYWDDISLWAMRKAKKDVKKILDPNNQYKSQEELIENFEDYYTLLRQCENNNLKTKGRSQFKNDKWYSLNDYTYIIEYQKGERNHAKHDESVINGRYQLHFHCVYDKVLPVEMVKNMWNQEMSKYCHYSDNCLNVKAIKDLKGLGAYLSSYLTKNNDCYYTRPYAISRGEFTELSKDIKKIDLETHVSNDGELIYGIESTDIDNYLEWNEMCTIQGNNGEPVAIVVPFKFQYWGKWLHEAHLYRKSKKLTASDIQQYLTHRIKKKKDENSKFSGNCKQSSKPS